jgi:hypothetical protein
VLESPPSSTGSFYDRNREALEGLSQTLGRLSREQLELVFGEGGALKTDDLVRFISAEAKARRLQGNGWALQQGKPVLDPASALQESIRRFDSGAFVRLLGAYQQASQREPPAALMRGRHGTVSTPDWHALMNEVTQQFIAGASSEHRARAALRLTPLIERNVCYPSTSRSPPFQRPTSPYTHCSDARGVAVAELLVSLENEPQRFFEIVNEMLKMKLTYGQFPPFELMVQAAMQPVLREKVFGVVERDSDPAALMRLLSTIERLGVAPGERPYTERATPLGATFVAAISATDRFWQRGYWHPYTEHLTLDDIYEIDAANLPQVRAVIDRAAAMMAGNNCGNAAAIAHYLRAQEKISGTTMTQLARYVALRPEEEARIASTPRPSHLGQTLGKGSPQHPWLGRDGYFKPIMLCLNGGYEPGDPRRVDHYLEEYQPGLIPGSHAREWTRGALANHVAASLGHSHTTAIFLTSQMRIHDKTRKTLRDWSWYREIVADGCKKVPIHKMPLLAKAPLIEYAGDVCSIVIKGWTSTWAIDEVIRISEDAQRVGRVLKPWVPDLTGSQLPTYEEQLKARPPTPDDPDGSRFRARLKKSHDEAVGETAKVPEVFAGSAPEALDVDPKVQKSPSP